MKQRSQGLHGQTGFSLIEVLVAVLLVSIGLLSLTATLSFAVQAPKLSGYRATAVNLASGYVERMRANAEGFASGAYDQAEPADKAGSYDGSRAQLPLVNCAYPACTVASMAVMDSADLKSSVRATLPAGGALMQRDSSGGIASSTDGNLWIVWQEPTSLSALPSSTSDNCPAEITSKFSSPTPHCLYVRFRL